MIPLFKVRMAAAASEIVGRTLHSGVVTQGPRVEEFEEALRTVLGASVLTVNSGTSAITLALHLSGVGPGDEVVVTPMTCTATVCPIVTRGARPVWADIDPLTGLIDPADVARKTTELTRAVVAVDFGGRPCDYAALKAAAPDIPLIVDAAHSFGATYHGEPIARCPDADYVCWSFQAIKHLTTGDGGAIRVPSGQVERAKRLRWFGLDRVPFAGLVGAREAGYKFHMNDIAASIGLANLPEAMRSVEDHRRNAAAYAMLLASCHRVVLPPPSAESSWWLYPILVDDREAFIAHMAARGVECNPVHGRADAHASFQFPAGPLPGVDYYATREVAIPVGWWLGPQEIAFVAEAVARFDGRGW